MFKLLKKVSEALEEREISYMLSGSLAMSTYTVPRMTRDIDIVINLKLSDVEKFTEIFHEGYYLYKEGIPPHSPAMFRINGVVRNIPEFYEAFTVKPTDSLYLAPEKRVKIF